MVQRLSSNEAKQRWGSTLRSVDETGDGVILEIHGKPKYAIIPIAEFEEFQRLKEMQRRESILQELYDLSDRIGNKNADLTEDQIEELADRHSREVMEELVRAGKIRFETSSADEGHPQTA